MTKQKTDYKELLRQHGVPPSVQRIRIIEFLDNHRTHPTVDQIYTYLKDDIPTLSKTTVYNTLKRLADKGLVLELNLFEKEVRYEFNINPHIHFKCVKCGRIYDLNGSFSPYNDKTLEGHQITEHHINLKGICRNCLEKERVNA